jgi:hypothetical protein
MKQAETQVCLLPHSGGWNDTGRSLLPACHITVPYFTRFRIVGCLQDKKYIRRCKVAEAEVLTLNTIRNFFSTFFTPLPVLLP